MFKNISKILNSYLVKFKDDFVNSAKDKKKTASVINCNSNIFVVGAIYV